MSPLNLEPQSRVEGISSALVLGSQTLHFLLGISASRLSGIVGTAHVDQLVAHKVRNDVRVQGIALTAVGDEGIVGREERSLGRLPVEFGTAKLEVDGGCAVTKVGGGGGGCLGRDSGDEGGNDDVVLHLGGFWLNYVTDVC